MSSTFAVHDVSPGERRFAMEDAHLALSMTLREVQDAPGKAPGKKMIPSRGPESYAFVDLPRGLIGVAVHPVVAAATESFNGHLPLRLSPDHIWALVLQGISTHMALDPERHRASFVTHQEKLTLSVRNDEVFTHGAREDWRRLLSQWSEAIEEHIGRELVRDMCPEFSTTGELELAVYRASLMDVMKNYFEYSWVSLCGTPSITLEGEVADWEGLHAKLDVLERFELGWWRESLTVIFENFVSAARGAPDVSFWKSMVQHHSQSGGDVWTGWITDFFPYIDDSGQLERNPYLGRSLREPESAYGFVTGFKEQQFGGPMSRIPAVWTRLDERIDMELLTGFVGMTQRAEDGALRPELGWAVRYAMP